MSRSHLDDDSEEQVKLNIRDVEAKKLLQSQLQEALSKSAKERGAFFGDNKQNANTKTEVATLKSDLSSSSEGAKLKSATARAAKKSLSRGKQQIWSDEEGSADSNSATSASKADIGNRGDKTSLSKAETGNSDYRQNKQGTLHGEIVMPGYFTARKAHSLLEDTKPSKRRSSPIRGNIRPNTAFVLNLSKHGADMLRDYPDGSTTPRCWRSLRTELRPNTVPMDERPVYVIDYILQDRGMDKPNCFKSVYTFRNNKFVKQIESWDPPIALVYYKGTGNLNISRPPRRHGNQGTKYKAISVKTESSDDNDFKGRTEKPSKSADDHSIKPIESITDEAVRDETGEGKTAHEEIVKASTTAPAQALPLAKAEDKASSEWITSSDNDYGVYLKTPKKTMKAIESSIKAGKKGSLGYGDLVLTSSKKKNFEPPRNVKQLYNKEYNMKEKEEKYDNDLGDVMHVMMSTDYSIITDMKVGKLRVLQQHPGLLEHFATVKRKHKPLFFYYDTTFDIGNFYTSLLSVKHPFLLTEDGQQPTIPLAAMYHVNQDRATTHRMFFKKLCRAFPTLAQDDTFIVTDREASIRGAIAEILPKAKNLFCYNHMIKNVRSWTSSNCDSKRQARIYRKNFRQLLWVEDENGLRDLLKKFCPKDHRIDIEGFEEDVCSSENDICSVVSSPSSGEGSEDDEGEEEWTEKFKNYYFRHLHRDVTQNYRGKIAKHGVFNKNSGMTTNPAENIHGTVKDIIIKKQTKGTMYGASSVLYTWQNKLQFDIQRGLRGEGGDFRPNKDFRKQAKAMPTQDIVYTEDVFKDDEREKALKKKDHSFANDVNYSNKVKLARQHLRKGLVKHLFYDDGTPTGTIAVKTMIRKSEFVTTQENRCTCGNRRCFHKLAALMLTGQWEDPKAKNLNQAPPTNMTDVQKLFNPPNVGKKRGQRRLPQEFDDPKLSTMSPKDHQERDAAGKKRRKTRNVPSNAYAAIKSPKFSPAAKVSNLASNRRTPKGTKTAADPRAVQEDDQKEKKADVEPKSIERHAEVLDKTSSETIGVEEESDNESESDMPILTKDNCSIGLLNVGAAYMTLKDFASIRDNNTPHDRKVLSRVGEKECQDGWLSDNAVFAYLYELASGSRFRVLSWPQLQTILTENRPLRRKVPAMRGEPEWEDTDLVLMPFCREQVHWALLVADKANKQINCYDSLGDFTLDRQQRKYLSFFLNQMFDKPTSGLWKVNKVPCAKQKDGKSCGVYVCHFGKVIMNGSSSTSVAESPAPDMRNEIFKAIVGGCDLKAALYRHQKKVRQEDERCSICKVGEGSQYSQESGSLVNWAQCEKCEGWRHLKCNPTPLTNSQVESTRFVCSWRDQRNP